MGQTLPSTFIQKKDLVSHYISTPGWFIPKKKKKKAWQLHKHINLVNFFLKKYIYITFGCQHIAKKGPTLACYLPADLIVAIYLVAFLDAFKVSVVIALLFLYLFYLWLDWLSVGGEGAVVVTSLVELGCALCTVGWALEPGCAPPTVGLFAWPSLAACKHKHKHKHKHNSN